MHYLIYIFLLLPVFVGLFLGGAWLVMGPAQFYSNVGDPNFGIAMILYAPFILALSLALGWLLALLHRALRPRGLDQLVIWVFPLVVGIITRDIGATAAAIGASLFCYLICKIFEVRASRKAEREPPVAI